MTSVTDDMLDGFLAGERQWALPATLVLDGTDEQVCCERLLRLVPRRRAVLQGRWQGRAVAAKLFVRDSHAQRRMQREIEGVQRLRAAGLPTPALLKQGRSRCGRVGVLLFEWVADGEPAGQRWRRLDNAARQTLMQQVARLLAAMHEAGLHQTDCHLDNFLTTGAELTVLDTGSVRGTPGTPLPDTDSLDNLALLVAQLPLLEQVEALTVLGAYRDARGMDEAPPGAVWARRVERRWRKRAADYRRKSLRECTDFAVTRTADRFQVGDRTLENTLAPFFADPDACMARGTLLKDGNTATVARVTLADRDLVIKRYNRKNRWTWLKRCWRTSRARRSWLNAWLLTYIGIDTPRPRALLESRRGPLVDRAWLVTDAVPATMDLGHCVAEPRWQQAVVRVFRGLSLAGVSHGDMKASNWLVGDDRLWLVDLDAMRWHRCPALARRALARDVRRFLRNDFDPVPWRAALAEAEIPVHLSDGAQP